MTAFQARIAERHHQDASGVALQAPQMNPA
jgi:hypothetical protein